jgi:hypothetical protein
LRLLAPLGRSELQVVLQREGAAFTVIEGVEELVRGDDSDFVLLRFAQGDQRREGGREIRVGDDDDVRARALLFERIPRMVSDRAGRGYLVRGESD